MPEEYYPLMGRRIQGCDTCQQACPKNDHLKREPPPEDLFESLKLEALLTQPDIERFKMHCTGYAISEGSAKFQAVLAAANTGRKDLLPLIEKFIGGEDAKLERAARWAFEILSK